jgi:hypothetical protein
VGEGGDGEVEKSISSVWLKAWQSISDGNLRSTRLRFSVPHWFSTKHTVFLLLRYIKKNVKRTSEISAPTAHAL